MIRLYLSRRNLKTLLSKLDRAKAGEGTFCTIVKNDMSNSKFPQSHPQIVVTAVEDEDYYFDRIPGPINERDAANIKD